MTQPTVPQPVLPPPTVSLTASRMALAIAAGRAAAGLGMLARPDLLSRPLGIDAATATRVRFLPRMLGARELVVAAVAIHAVRRGSVRPTLATGVALDAVDLWAVGGATVRGEVSRPAGAAVAAIAAGAVLAGVRGLLTRS